MASIQSGEKFLKDINRLFNEGTVAGEPDEQLLQRFIARSDEVAFGALVARYGPMVLSVCLGVLRDINDAEDAFQATFLVLVRRAGSIRHTEALGGWLHRVAVRVAVDANRASCPRRAEERRAGERATMNRPLDREQDDWSSVLHEELDRLPGRYRLPIVLCHLQNLSHAQAATKLRQSVGTLRRRLDRGLELLRCRLARRGAGAASGLAGVLLVRPSEAAVPAAWLSATIRAATRGAASRTVAAGAGSATAAVLAEGVLKAMFFTRLKVVATALAVVATAGVAAGMVITSLGAGDDPPRMKKTQGLPPPGALAQSTSALKDQKGESFIVRGRVIGPDKKPFAGAKLYLGNLQPEKMTEPPKVQVTSGADGRFELSISKSEYEDADTGESWRSVPIIASAQGYGPDWVELAKMDNTEITLQLVKDDVPIEGRVLDLQGRPVAGAKVSIMMLKAPAKNDLEPYLTLVRSDPFTASNYNFEKRLEGGAQILGQPVSITTAKDGRFRLSGFGRDRVVDLAIEGPGIQSASLTAMTRASGPVTSEKGKDLSIRSLGARFDHLNPPRRSVTGIVRDKGTGKPIAQMSVSGQATNSRMTTGADGRFTVSGFPKGKRYDLMAIPIHGAPYFITCVNVPDSAGLAPIESNIECVRGIPYRLKLTDKETGKPIQKADVSYEPVYPNPHTREVSGLAPINGVGPYNSARQEPDGTYVSAVLPGPGAVFVRVRDANQYMPACVDPKAFFKDTPSVGLEGMAFGDRTLLYIAAGADGAGAMPQDQFTAIILVNPPADSKPLALDFAVERAPNVKVTVLGPGGKPVTGVTGDNAEATPDSSVFSISRLNPMRPRRVTFAQPDKHLVGFLMARGDEPERPSVTLQPWGAISGRLVNAQGKPRPHVKFQTKDWQAIVFDPVYGMVPGGTTDGEGRFRVDALVPGQKYAAIVIGLNSGDEFGSLFEDIVLKPGETKDLGDVHSLPPRKAAVQ